MLRFFLALHLLFFYLYACKDDFALCVQKAQDANVVQNASLFIPVAPKQTLVYTHKTPKAKIIKYDPFLSLYIIKEQKNFPYPYDMTMRLELATAIINEKKAKVGKFLQKQVGLNSFGLYNQLLKDYPALISNSCCSLEGIVTKKGVIEKAYIVHFINTKEVAYSDIGIRVVDAKGFVVVDASDPFMKDNPFLANDRIVAYDKKKVASAAMLMQKILFSRLGSQHIVKVKRGDKFVTFKVVSQKRYGGGFISDTFLEQKGIYFDETLHVKRVEKEFQNLGLHLGDRLIQVNGVRVNNQKELRKYIQNFKEYASLLFQRNNFQFFVNIK